MYKLWNAKRILEWYKRLEPENSWRTEIQPVSFLCIRMAFHQPWWVLWRSCQNVVHTVNWQDRFSLIWSQHITQIVFFTRMCIIKPSLIHILIKIVKIRPNSVHVCNLLIWNVLNNKIIPCIVEFLCSVIRNLHWARK